MIDQRAFRTVAMAMLLLASSAAWARAQDTAQPPVAAGPQPGAANTPKSGKTARPDRPVQAAAPESEEPGPGAALGAVGKVLPLGQKNIDVKIPSFKDGIPSSTVRAASMTRLDDENMTMERMDIRLFGKTHQEDVRIQLPTALYHMPSQILSSETRSRITRQDFDLQGDSMVFDTRTGQGKMVGNVRMVVYDADSLTAPKTEGPAAAQEKASDGDKTPATDKNAEAPPAPATAPLPTPPSSPPVNEKK
jgi:hypothetical protein